MRVMVDANILVSGIALKREPTIILNLALDNEFDLILCEYAISEAKKWLEGKYGSEFVDLLNLFLDRCDFELIPNPGDQSLLKYSTYIRDRKDVPIVAAAFQAKVDCIVSKDTDFLDENEQTQKIRSHIVIYGPRDFLSNVMGLSRGEIRRIIKEYEN